MLDRIRIILSRPTHPGNIGAAARAMKTMGLTELVLVQPRRYPDAEATARASGADDLLARARVVADLSAAIGDCGLVLGTSARLRRVPLEQLDPRRAAERALAATGRTRVALLFGQERSGLDNAEIAACHALVNIPTSSRYGSLNLAAAVQVLCYELRMSALEKGVAEAAAMPEHVPAAGDKMEGLIEHLRTTLLEIGFLDPKQYRTMMVRLRRLLNRASPSESEIHILRGILSAVDRLGKQEQSEKAKKARGATG